MKSRKNTNINKGAMLFSIVFVLLFFALIARFGYIEITKQVEGKGLTDLAEKKWLTNNKLYSHRGTIFDASGEALAKDVPAYTITAVLSKKMKDRVKDPAQTARKLAPILDMKEADLERMLSKKAFQVELGSHGRRISYEKKEKIENLHLPGIGFLPPQSKRFYPNETFASYVLGFTERDNDADRLRGIMGIEKSMNKMLTGTDGSGSYRGSIGGVQLPDSEEKKKPMQNGDNVYLTIDSHIETFLEHAMKKAEKKYKPNQMMAVVADPKTGKILAMANSPSFDPNKRNIDNYRNAIISDPFEPGSTMKIFTLSAAVDAGVYNGNEKYKSGTYTLPAGGQVSDWNNQGWGSITYNEGVRRSSNVAFAKLARDKVGFDRFYNYLEAFDLRKRTGIALPDEANSMFQYHVPIEKTTTAFGQGTAITAMQMVKGATAIANDGKMMKPYIINKVVNPNNGQIVLENQPKVAGQPISADSAKKVRDLLRTVVTGEHGTGKEFDIKDYKVAGKTGTAQIPKKDGSGYIEDKYIHSFIGMAPKDDPKLIVYVVVDRPDVENYHFGSKPVADIFNFVMKHSLQYLNIEPKQSEKAIQPVSISDYKGQSAKGLKQTLQNKGLDVVTVGSDDEVTEQMPFSETTVFPGERVLLRTGGKVEMPDLTGWSLADVMKFADLLHLQPDIKGSGYAVSQNIPPGNPMKEGEMLIVNLSPSKPASSDDKKEKSKQ